MTFLFRKMDHNVLSCDVISGAMFHNSVTKLVLARLVVESCLNYLTIPKHVSSNFLRKQLFEFRANRSIWDFHFTCREKEQNARNKTTISMSHILLNKVTTNKYEGAEMFNIRIDYTVKRFLSFLVQSG
uniref:Uncharacterized protein n=1 Tax=Glossina palpalis gambiensis TaxID=67801 RepID=A0A1B0AU20_9MUSC